MRSPVYCGCLLAVVCVSGLGAADRDGFTVRGISGRSFFDPKGQAGLVYSGGDGRILFASPGSGRIEPKVFKDCGPGTAVPSLRIRKDGLQRSWLVWEEKAKPSDGHVFLGRLENNVLVDVFETSGGLAGRHHAPDLDISPGGRPFTVWIQTLDTESRLILKGTLPEQSWIVRTSAKDSLFSPRLLADAAGRIWIFWVEAAGGPDEIFVSRLEGQILTPATSLTPGTGVPHFHPAVGKDPRGNPLLAWASYDGDDYQIYLRAHDGIEWLPPAKLTDVRGTADVQPSLALLLGSIPVVAWLRDDGGQREVLLTYRMPDGEWHPARSVSGPGEPGLHAPELVAEGDRLAVSWISETGLHLQVATLEELKAAATRPLRKPADTRSAAFRADDAFICFGDSITYGILAPPWDIREFGYPPRLKILLEALYANPSVINRGVPGEDTWSGLSRIADIVTRDPALHLLLMEGTNDVSSESFSMITTAFNLNAMISKCLSHGVFPLLATIIPRKGDRWNDFTRSRTLNLNNRIRNIAREQAVLLVEMFDAFYYYPEALGGWQSLIADAPDNLHPSLKGYQVMAETWFAHIARIPFPPVDAAARRMMKDGTVRLTWKPDPRISAETGLSNIKILRKYGNETDFRAIGLVPSSQFAYLDENPDLSREPVYALKASTVAGLEGPLSGPVFPVQGDPYPPVNVKFRTEANRAYLKTEYINVVVWSENPANRNLFDIGAYKIYRKKRSEASPVFVLIGETSPASREFLDRGLGSAAEAAQYVYGVSAVDIQGVEGALGSGPEPAGMSRTTADGRPGRLDSPTVRR